MCLIIIVGPTLKLNLEKDARNQSIKPCYVWLYNLSVLQSQNAVNAYFASKQLGPYYILTFLS